MWLDIAKYEPFKGGYYIPLPKYLANKKAIINVKNKDNDCFRWAIKSALFPTDSHSDRTSSYPSNEDDGLDFTEIESPTPINQIKKFENKNQFAVNVFGYINNRFIIHHISKMNMNIKRFNLLLIEEDDKFHYTYMKNFNKLLFDQTKHRERKYFCENCLTGYSIFNIFRKS